MSDVNNDAWGVPLLDQVRGHLSVGSLHNLREFGLSWTFMLEVESEQTLVYFNFELGVWLVEMLLKGNQVTCGIQEDDS